MLRELGLAAPSSIATHCGFQKFARDFDTMARTLVEDVGFLDAHAVWRATASSRDLMSEAGSTVRLDRNWIDASGRRRTNYFEMDLAACRYGGVRAYFLCPAETCGRRCTRLYCIDEHWLCRRCHGLAYQTQRLHKARRMLLRSRKMRARIGGTDASGCMNPRPKGMWEKKYYRVWIEADHLADRAFAYVMSQHPEWGKLS